MGEEIILATEAASELRHLLVDAMESIETGTLIREHFVEDLRTWAIVLTGLIAEGGGRIDPML
jgi:hypothetical protein